MGRLRIASDSAGLVTCFLLNELIAWKARQHGSEASGDSSGQPPSDTSKGRWNTLLQYSEKISHGPWTVIALGCLIGVSSVSTVFGYSWDSVWFPTVAKLNTILKNFYLAIAGLLHSWAAFHFLTQNVRRYSTMLGLYRGANHRMARLLNTLEEQISQKAAPLNNRRRFVPSRTSWSNLVSKPSTKILNGCKCIGQRRLLRSCQLGRAPTLKTHLVTSCSRCSRFGYSRLRRTSETQCNIRRRKCIASHNSGVSSPLTWWQRLPDTTETPIIRLTEQETRRMSTPVVFISAATIDLSTWRAHLHTAFSRAGFRVRTQDESLSSATGNVKRLLIDTIAESDCVIHLAGLGYGSHAQSPFPEAPEFQCSWTQFEYYQAHAMGKKVIAFACAPSLSADGFVEKGDPSERAHKAQLQLRHRSGSFLASLKVLR